jgi:hypothetical protein
MSPAWSASTSAPPTRCWPMPKPVARRSSCSISSSWWRPAKWARRRCCPRRYHPAAGELAEGELQLPWQAAMSPAGVQDAVVGRLARSWAPRCRAGWWPAPRAGCRILGVDRTAPILPWGAPNDVPKVSPVAASASYLAYLRAAWNARPRSIRWNSSRTVLTVPASFDEGARALTLEAARLAGLPACACWKNRRPRFYDWLHRHRDTLAATWRIRAWCWWPTSAAAPPTSAWSRWSWSKTAAAD